MSDFNFSTSVSRDEFARALADNSEHAAYVLGEFADLTAQTSDRDDMLDILEYCQPHHKEGLAMLCHQILGRLEPEGGEA